MKGKKLKDLEESFESGAINKKEYEKKKKEIKNMPEKARKAEEEEVKESKLKSDRILIIGVILLISAFAAAFSWIILTKEQPKTLDQLHELNLKGELEEEQGYMHNNAYSFVKFDDLWYTQLVSPKGSRFYNIQFRFGPREVEPIEIEGFLDRELFNDATNYYVTFDPTGNDFSHVTLAVADFNQHMTNVFFKAPIAACDKNETFACEGRPVINCDNTDDIVLYIKEANKTRVYYDDNCMVVEGNGFELVKGVDRILYNLYGMMEQ
ncbi:MAG: hypothetical protein QF436_01895 [Candidatus Woesearchaeota archaeon]|jgi:hypothetical protein|nr:hypothetical protein [Candidatus Woesearchaeota archaeon]MDP7622843.1 hypothetical protein [Candidatus Woesearchaeota archaeon]HJN56897.1 hypothetical protein [Candidatus Woesearchaeota archaeon]|tara:strand:- start:39045 stop:39842 length:798 start_codon:yes stop_codon:yes gene_type:complete